MCSQVSDANPSLALSLSKAVNLASLFPFGATVQWTKLLRPFLGNKLR